MARSSLQPCSATWDNNLSYLPHCCWDRLHHHPSQKEGLSWIPIYFPVLFLPPFLRRRLHFIIFHPVSPFLFSIQTKGKERNKRGRVEKSKPLWFAGKRPLVSAPYACLFKEQKKKKVGSSRLKGREKERELVYLVPRILPPLSFSSFHLPCFIFDFFL